MKSTLHTFSALLAVGLYILLAAEEGNSQHVPSRCVCHKPLNRIHAPVKTFEVLLKRPGCSRDEIIVTLKKNDQKLCLSPNGLQGKKLLKCWHKMQMKGGVVQKCTKRLRRNGQKKNPR